MKFLIALFLALVATPSFAGWDRTPAVADTTTLMPTYYAVKIEEGRRLVVAHIEVDSISGLNYWDLDTLNITHLKINSSDETAYLNITADDNVNDRDGSIQAAIELQPSGASSFPSIIFGDQDVNHYGGLVWTNSTSGNNGNEIRGQIFVIPAGENNTASRMVFYTNDNAGPSGGSAAEPILILEGSTGFASFGRSSSPSRPLHVVNTSSSATQLVALRLAVNATGTGTETGLEFYMDDDGTPTALGFISGREQTGGLESLYFTANGASQGMFLYDDGNLSVGKDSTAQKLLVNGVIESLTGGFKFPDGTIQTTAGGGGGGGGGSNVLTAADGTPSQAVYVNNENDVGIGTSTPNFGSQDMAVTISTGGSPTLSTVALELQATGSTTPETFARLDFYDDSYNTASILARRTRDSNSSSLQFNTSVGGLNSSRVSIDSNGNVGIGTVTPTQKLELFGSSHLALLINSSTGNPAIHLKQNGVVEGYLFTDVSNSNTIGLNASGTGNGGLHITQSDRIGIGTGSPDATMNLTVSGVEGGSGGLALWADEGDDSSDKFNLFAGADGYLYITGNGAYAPGDLMLSSSGQFGINTTPSHQFHVKGDGQASVLEPETSTLHTFQRSTNAGAGLNFGVEGVAGGAIASGTSAYSGVVSSSVSGTKLHLASEGTTVLTIDQNQSVGIGTTTPEVKLHVTGSSGEGIFQLGDSDISGYDNQYQYINFGGNTLTDKAWQLGKASESGSIGPPEGFYLYNFHNSGRTVLVADSTGRIGLGGKINPSSTLDLAISSNPGVFVELENTLASQADLQFQSRGSGDAGVASTGNLTLDAGATLGAAATTNHFKIQSDGSIWLEGSQRFDGSNRLVPHTVASTTTFTNLNADLLDGYNTATAATASTIPVRDGSGRMKAVSPAASDDVATKGYVDGISSADGYSLNAADGTPADQIYIDNDGNVQVNSLTRFNASGALVPHTVASTSVFTNLNADLLDGVEESAFARLAQNETVTGSWTFGNSVSTSNNNLTIGTGILYGNSRSLSLGSSYSTGVAAEFRSAASTASGIRLLDSASGFRSFWYGDGTSQGFLNSTGGWLVEWNNGTLNTGTVPVARISGTLPAAQVQDGTGTGLDADLLDGLNGATTGSASTVMIRDGSGRSQVAEPSASSDIATKNYVDTQVAASAGSVGPWTYLDGGRTNDGTVIEIDMSGASSATQLLIAIAGSIIEPATEDDWIIYGLTSKSGVKFTQRDTIGVTDGAGGTVIGWIFEGNAVLETKTTSSIDLAGTILLNGSDCTLRWDYQNDLFELARNGGECAIGVWHR